MSLPIDTVEKFWSYPELEKAIREANSESLPRFKHEFKDFLGASESVVELFPSGRQALEWLLESLNDCGSEVLAPAFNCGVVETAVNNAGFALKTYDFCGEVGRFDWDLIAGQISSETCAVIVTHYFGVPVDFRKLVDVCESLSIPVIEDCAHCVGGKIGDRSAGTLGQAAVFSFNDDKPIALGWGGAAIISPDFVQKKSIDLNLVTPDAGSSEERLIRFLRRSHLKRRLVPYMKSPIIKAGLKAFKALRGGNESRRYSSIGVGAVQAELGRQCLEKYEFVMDARNRNAEVFERASMNPTWPVGSSVDPAWLRQKVYLGESKEVDDFINRMHKRGIRVDNLNWPQVLARDQSNCEISKEGARFWVDIPVHQNLTNEMVERIAEYLNEMSRN